MIVRAVFDVEMRGRCTGVRDLIDCAREEGGAVEPGVGLRIISSSQLRKVSGFSWAKRFSQKLLG